MEEATAADQRAHATAVVARVAAICDKIKEHRNAGKKPMSARHVAVISAMIDNIDAPKKWSEAKPGVVVKSVRRDGCDAGDILREACFMAACGGHRSVVGYRGVTRSTTPAGAGIDQDAGDDDDDYSLVADGAAGPRTLADMLRDHGRLFPEADVRRIMRQLLLGVEAMAERGVVHRDINPANVLYVSGTIAFKIAGFGAAKHAAEKDPPELFAGTNGYTAPEVLLENAGHGAPVDAWSLGCVMLQLLTGGRLPFAGKDKADQLRKILDVLGEVQVVAHGCCNTLRELVPEKVLSEKGFQVLNGLLNCDPNKRLTAAAALQCPWFTDNALNDDDLYDYALLVAARLDMITTAATQAWAMVSQMAVSFAERTLGIAQVYFSKIKFD